MHFLASWAAGSENKPVRQPFSLAACAQPAGASREAGARTDPVLVQHEHVEPLVRGLLRAQPLDLLLLLPRLEQPLVADVAEPVCAEGTKGQAGRRAAAAVLAPSSWAAAAPAGCGRTEGQLGGAFAHQKRRDLDVLDVVRLAEVVDQVGG